MISVHGLIRGKELELGHDSDTGGQVGYVLDLARATSKIPAFSRVELLTRRIFDANVSPDYQQEFEQLDESNVRIVRLVCGPRRYLRKELLWSHLDEYVDRSIAYFRSQHVLPDLIHTHYADSGYVGLQLSAMLGIPHIHTGHSLGRVKQAYLTDMGISPKRIEARFRISKRIDVEEQLLADVSATITSSKQEIEEQYGLYHVRRRSRMVTIPPGMDLSRFHPPPRGWTPNQWLSTEIDHFLKYPEKPMILALARADRRKNLSGLVMAYASSRELRERANLLIIAGNRDDIDDLESSQAEVIREMLALVDKYDLYGRVSLPKHHSPEDVPDIYRLAFKRRGVFVNASHGEGFGLTLIEAAASGLPIVATYDGGPREIVERLRNGLLVDPSDPSAIASALGEAINSGPKWRWWSRNGINGVERHYTWEAHVTKYSKLLTKVIRSERKTMRKRIELLSGPKLISASKMIVIDIDETMLGDTEGLVGFTDWLGKYRSTVAFAVATGRTADAARKVLQQHGIDLPDVYISAVGSEISYGARLQRDPGWSTHISDRWRRSDIQSTLLKIPGLRLQTQNNQREFKISYMVDVKQFPGVDRCYRALREMGLHARLIYSRDKYLDALPARASKGHAVRYLSYKWGIPLERVLTAGDSGNDEEMLIGTTLGVIVGNHSQELDHLKGKYKVYFAKAPFVRGVLEGIQHHHFDEL